MQDPPCLSQAVPGSTRDEKDADWMRLLIMREARTNGAAAACKKYGVPYWKARYLEMKSFGAHPNKHGGRRYSTLTPAAQLLLEWSAFIIWSEAPRNGDYQVMQMLKEHLGWDWMEGGPDGSARTRVHRIRKNVLKFTNKKASVINPKKYTIGNILKMYQYLDWVPTIPVVHLLFMDEVHLRDSDLYGVQGCKSYPGQRVWNASQAFVIQMDTVMAAYEAGMFVRGDKLILDNARVHTARDVVEPLKVLLAGVGVELVFLPAYSPEFNPCELAFGMVKSFMRKHRGGGSFFTEIVHAFAVAITRPKIYKAYLHCSL
eukprot:g42248.t1